ncbi:MAG: F0F1 ATP synthase subunit B [Prevotella sp.]|uniref:F0F1 ATP synthase subunit B n=1 Tax=Prevotella sp. TaxID=59823 RepID=UPI002A29EABF|nr:F0F1 ATP synthase subunit B [Prevotella sp.]MDD7319219.1 F0F1 ATP synthase subunit B [Prevotellaceae bacterium]MDY4020138.1 F0F1 ATP synthase subunit B [Prevotella sp.]
MDFQNLPSILTPDLGLLFWMLLAFLVIFYFLARHGFPVITKMVEERKAYIDESLRKAHDANEKLANIQKEGETMLKEARERQAQILAEAASTRDAIIEQAHTKAREEGTRIISEAKAQIEADKMSAISDIRKQVAEISISVAEKILRERLSDEAEQMKYVDKLLDELSYSAK